MGYFLYPLLVLAFFQGLFAIEKARTTAIAPVPSVQRAAWDGREFVAYRDAVSTYLQANPAYIGSVSSAALIAQGNQFSAQFLSVAGNYISQVGGGSGRVITCYARLSTGAITAALNATSNDASLGMAAGGNWTSYAQGVSTTPQPLATTVPDGDVVSVVQIGS